MNYTLRIAGRDIPLDIDLSGEGALSGTLDGQAVNASYRVISENHILVELDGKAVNAFLAEGPDGMLVHVGGIAYLVQDADTLARAGSKRRGKELPQEVTPPMPAVVVRIMASPGDRVEKGQAVAVVSAMKMETTLQAPYAGTVVRVNTAEGEKVMPGQILMDIERDAGPSEQAQ
jgi:3-methylcrotonyl-CoA carboxylase alpha subunit